MWYNQIMNICGFEKFSMVDYDGKIACTVFTEGCNFRCPFCQNAALVTSAGTNEIIAESEIFDYLDKRKTLVDAVCVSGGEPTLQKDLESFMEKIKKMGFLVKLDTNGYRPEILRKLLKNKLLDYVAMDIKASKEKYAEVAGLYNVDLTAIDKSVAMLKDGSVDYEFRTTLMREYHDESAMRDIADRIDGAKRYFMQKYKDGDGCIAHGFHPVDEAVARGYVGIFENRVGQVGLRGYN